MIVKKCQEDYRFVKRYQNVQEGVWYIKSFSEDQEGSEEPRKFKSCQKDHEGFGRLKKMQAALRRCWWMLKVSEQSLCNLY